MNTSRNVLVAGMSIAIAGLAAPSASAQGLIAQQRLSSALANEAVGEAVTVCAKNGYAVTAIIVDIDGVRQAVLRGDGAAVHTLDSAYFKAYTAASLAPVRKETSTKEIFERLAKQPGMTTSGLASLPFVTFTPGRRHHHGGRQADRRHRGRRRAGRQLRRRLRPCRARQDQGPDEVNASRSFVVPAARSGDPDHPRAILRWVPACAGTTVIEHAST